MDETTPEPRRAELPHLRFADADEERRHVLRERVGYYVPTSEPCDLVLSRASRGELVQVRTDTLVALLDLLDHHGQWRCVGPNTLRKAETVAYDRGYEAGYRSGREDQREGFDALGTDEDEELERVGPLITDREWKVGDTYRTTDGTLWRVTRLESHPIGTIPWVVQVPEAEEST